MSVHFTSSFTSKMSTVGDQEPRGDSEKASLYSSAVPDAAEATSLTFDSVTLDASENPQNFSTTRRWICTVTVVVMTATIAFCSSIHTAAISNVAQYFHCSRVVATLGVTTFLLGFASGPLIFAPLSEEYGRNIIYRITLLLFVIFNMACALAPNIQALLVFRFFCGFWGSPTGRLRRSSTLHP